MPSRRRAQLGSGVVGVSSVGYLPVAVCTVYTRAHAHAHTHLCAPALCIGMRQCVSWQRVSIPVLDNILLYFLFLLKCLSCTTHTLAHTVSRKLKLLQLSLLGF